jgi:hypothetical protein
VICCLVSWLFLKSLRTAWRPPIGVFAALPCLNVE